MSADLPWLACWLLGFCFSLLAAGSAATEVRVAVAANFLSAAEAVAATYSAATGHRVTLSAGSTGQLFAQISRGAPFDVFLAADQARPARAEQDGHAVAGSRFTYALGALVLYSADTSRVTGSDSLHTPSPSRLALANPATAPYGAAALEVLRALGLEATLAGRLVRGNSVSQTYQFVATGNVELGFVARSQVYSHTRGSRWNVPAELHSPIAQDAVLLSGARHAEAASRFLFHLRSDATRSLLREHGYELP